MSDLKLNWSFLPWQLEVWNDPTRFRVLVCGRRTGKSNFAIKNTLYEALQAPKGSAVVYVAPTQAQARQICWEALLEEGRELIKSAHVNAMDITMHTGTKIHVRSAENPDTLRGLKLHFAVIDEAAFCPKEDLWSKVLRPALADLKGRALFISSPDGRNWLYDLYRLGLSGSDKDWKSFHFTTFDNPTIDPKEIEAARKTLSSHAFKTEFLASFDNAGSDVFKPEWWKESKEPKFGEYIVAIDLAGFEDVAAANASAAKKRLDETAIAIVKVDDENKWFVEDVLHFRKTVDATAAEIFRVIADYQPKSIGIERGIAKKAVMGPLQALMRQYNRWCHIEELTHGNKNKADRIVWALQGRMEHGRIRFNEDKDWDEFKDQLLMFPTAGVHDDMVDALAYVAQLETAAYTQDYDEDDYEPIDSIAGY